MSAVGGWERKKKTPQGTSVLAQRQHSKQNKINVIKNRGISIDARESR